VGHSEISELTGDYSLKKSKNQITCSQFSHSQIDILTQYQTVHNNTTLLLNRDRERKE
jgi:hypothetical protein